MRIGDWSSDVCASDLPVILARAQFAFTVSFHFIFPSFSIGLAGFLAALVPEAYGGSGLNLAAAAVIMEEIQASGCNGSACHAQMYIMNTVLRHGSEEIGRASCRARVCEYV